MANGTHTKPHEAPNTLSGLVSSLACYNVSLHATTSVKVSGFSYITTINFLQILVKENSVRAHTHSCVCVHVCV